MAHIQKIIGLSLVSSLAFCCLAVACKRVQKQPQNQQQQGSSSNPEAAKNLPLDQGKGGLSDEPSGLADYFLSCLWQQPPSAEISSAKLNCFPADSKGQPAQGISGAQWQLEGLASDIKIEKSANNAQLSLHLSGRSRDAVYAAIFDMQVSVQLTKPAKVELNASGRDLLKAAVGSQKVSAHCASFFNLMLIDEYSMATFSQLPRFENCEKLSEKLNNYQIPDPSLQTLPPPGAAKNLRASCQSDNLVLETSQPKQSVSHPTLSPQICQDLALLINAQGL